MTQWAMVPIYRFNSRSVVFKCGLTQFELFRVHCSSMMIRQLPDVIPFDRGISSYSRKLPQLQKICWSRVLITRSSESPKVTCALKATTEVWSTTPRSQQRIGWVLYSNFNSSLSWFRQPISRSILIVPLKPLMDWSPSPLDRSRTPIIFDNDLVFADLKSRQWNSFETKPCLAATAVLRAVSRLRFA